MGYFKEDYACERSQMEADEVYYDNLENAVDDVYFDTILYDLYLDTDREEIEELCKDAAEEYSVEWSDIMFEIEKKSTN
jgi:hypothetical protein